MQCQGAGADHTPAAEVALIKGPPLVHMVGVACVHCKVGGKLCRVKAPRGGVPPILEEAGLKGDLVFGALQELRARGYHKAVLACAR
eukprot:1140898-Pelagomonas_calceolata.AAC.3